MGYKINGNIFKYIFLELSAKVCERDYKGGDAFEKQKKYYSHKMWDLAYKEHKPFVRSIYRESGIKSGGHLYRKYSDLCDLEKKLGEGADHIEFDIELNSILLRSALEHLGCALPANCNRKLTNIRKQCAELLNQYIQKNYLEPMLKS